jgi:hypothetical protein
VVSIIYLLLHCSSYLLVILPSFSHKNEQRIRPYIQGIQWIKHKSEREFIKFLHEIFKQKSIAKNLKSKRYYIDILYCINTKINSCGFIFGLLNYRYPLIIFCITEDEIKYMKYKIVDQSKSSYR